MTTNPARDPGSVNELRRRLTAAATASASTVKRLQSLVANVAVCQMLPPAAIKGGTGIKLRLGEAMTRQTPDLDAAFRGRRDAFRADLAANLRAGWGAFTGTVTEGRPRPPAGVPAAYVMQPYIVKLLFHDRPFGTVTIELGYDELEATTQEPPELALSPDVADLFVELGLQTPSPVSVLPLHHQIAQKLHACTEPGNERAHDLVDLQLIAPLADEGLVAATTRRLFVFRQQHAWPAAIAPGPNWATLYADAVAGLDVIPELAEAVEWANRYIRRLTEI